VTWLDGDLNGEINPRDIKTHFIKNSKSANDSLSRSEFNGHSDNEFYTFCYESAVIARSGWFSPALKSSTKKGLGNSKKPTSLFDLLDLNNDNRIDLQEFKQPFKDMDKNSNFKVTREEVIRWLQTNNEIICKPHAKRIAIQLNNWK